MSKQFFSAYDEIIETIDYNEAKEIVNHGCQSGVCSQYIYYADTIRFFDEHEGEITDYVVESAGSDYVGEVLAQHNGDLDAYKNDMTWAFIEFVAMDVVDNVHDQELADDKIVEDYMQPIGGYNPPASINLNRYSHA